MNYDRCVADLPTNIRLDENLLRRIEAAAERFGMTKSGVIKLATSLFVNDFEDRGSRALPHDWEDILKNLDGRTHRYEGQHVHGDNNKVTQKKKSIIISDGAQAARTSGKKNKNQRKTQAKKGK